MPRVPPKSDSPAPSAYRGEEAGYASYTPELGSTGREAPVPTMPSTAAFMLMAHPKRWTVIGGQVVPQFSRLALKSGVNGVESRRQGDGKERLILTEARINAEAGGWTIIPFEAVPPNHVRPGARPSYLRQPKGRPDVTLLLYERCYPGDSAIGTDEPRYLEFCQHLIDSGVIAPPPVYILESMLAKAQHNANATADKARHNSNLKADADKMAAVVAVLEQALDGRREQLAAYEDDESYAPEVG